MLNSEIDVSKCEFYCEKYDGCYCFNSSKEVYAVNPNEHNSCEANINCYYKQLQQYKATLDEIERIAKNGVKDDCGMLLDELSVILNIIKQAKEGGVRND